VRATSIGFMDSRPRAASSSWRAGRSSDGAYTSSGASRRSGSRRVRARPRGDAFAVGLHVLAAQDDDPGIGSELRGEQRGVSKGAIVDGERARTGTVRALRGEILRREGLGVDVGGEWSGVNAGLVEHRGVVDRELGHLAGGLRLVDEKRLEGL